MSKIFSALSDLEIEQFNLSCAVSALNCVHDAMEEGPAGKEFYIPGLYTVMIALNEINKNMEKLVEKGFEAYREEHHHEQ